MGLNLRIQLKYEPFSSFIPLSAWSKHCVCIDIVVRVGNKLVLIVSTLFHVCAGAPIPLESAADPMWKLEAGEARAPSCQRVLPGGHLGCLCPRCFCLGNLRSLGSRLPWIRHTFWKGPDNDLLYQGFLPLTSFYWLMWARVLVSSWYSSSLPIWPRSKESNWFRMFLGIIEDTLETPIKC